MKKSIQQCALEALEIVNWTGLNIRQLAQAGRIGNPIQTAKDILPAFEHHWFDKNDFKQSVESGNQFVEILARELSEEIKANS